MKSQLKPLTKIDHIKIHEGIDLTKYSTMRLKSFGNLIEIYHIDSLKKVIKNLNDFNIKYQVIGWGANTILPFELKSKVLLKIDFKDYEVQDFFEKRDEYLLSACYPLPHLVKIGGDFHLSGFECLTGIPASIGGAVFMNAGTKLGEIKDLVSEIQIIDQAGEERTHKVTDKSFSYRKNHFLKTGEVISYVLLRPLGIDESVKNKIKEYREYRRKTQPLKESNCGCVFKNFEDIGAGQLIDELGLKGRKYKNLQISTLHANFIINHGDATLDDFSQFVDEIRETILRKTGREIECEVRY